MWGPRRVHWERGEETSNFGSGGGGEEGDEPSEVGTLTEGGAEHGIGGLI